MSGRYELMRSIARGGMAEVFLARITGEAGFEKLVALKRLPRALSTDPEVVDMLKDEARLAARLNHPNVVQVFDFGHDEEGYYIAMEYVPGPDLATVLRYLSRKQRKPPHAPMIAACIQMLRGLDYAHRLTGPDGQPLGVVHRDVSPSNLLLTSDGAVKVSDFGIARAQGRLVQTKAGSLKGKIPYMSPEQSRGKVVDLRTDVLSAGLVLWECLVGRRCYEAPSEADLLRKAAYADHQTFTQLGLDIPKPLEQIVERALQRDPAARFSSAGEMAQALETFHRQQHSRYTPDELGALVKESLEGFNPNQTSSGVPAISPGSNASSNSGPAQPISGPMDPHAQVTPAAIAMGTLPTLAHFNSGEPEHSTLEESADLPDEPSTTPSSPAIDLKSDPKLKPEPKPEPEVKKSNEEPHTFPSLKEYPVAEEAKKPKPAESGGRPVWLLMLIAMMASGGGFGLLAYLDHDPKTKDTIDPPQPSTPLEHPRGPTEASGPAAPTGGSEVKSSGSEDRPSHHNPRSPNSTGSNSSDRPSTATPGDGEVGYLTVRCDPKCNVQIEGSKTVFHAPVTKVPVPSGTHSIRLSSPEANLTMKAKVDIKAGLTTDRYFNLVMGR